MLHEPRPRSSQLPIRGAARTRSSSSRRGGRRWHGRRICTATAAGGSRETGARRNATFSFGRDLSRSPAILESSALERSISTVRVWPPLEFCGVAAATTLKNGLSKPFAATSSGRTANRFGPGLQVRPGKGPTRLRPEVAGMNRTKGEAHQRIAKIVPQSRTNVWARASAARRPSRRSAQVWARRTRSRRRLPLRSAPGFGTSERLRRPARSSRAPRFRAASSAPRA